VEIAGIMPLAATTLALELGPQAVPLEKSAVTLGAKTVPFALAKRAVPFVKRAVPLNDPVPAHAVMLTAGPVIFRNEAAPLAGNALVEAGGLVLAAMALGTKDMEARMESLKNNISKQ
jgi:hypothetical protein